MKGRRVTHRFVARATYVYIYIYIYIYMADEGDGK